jgi:urease accessory protein
MWTIWRSASVTEPAREVAGAQLLAAWLSPAWPVGAFAYSHGLEQAIADGAVTDRESLTAWVAAILRRGAGRNDAILLLAAMHDPDDPEPAALAAALCCGAERLEETAAQGAAFARVAAAAFGPAQDAAPYPVALGRAAAHHGLDPALVAPLYLQAFAANLISAAVRLVPLGQTQGAQALAAVLPVTRAVAVEAMAAGLDDLGGACLSADLAALRHETKPVRLFRT